MFEDYLENLGVFFRTGEIIGRVYCCEVFCLHLRSPGMSLWQKDGSREGWRVSEKKSGLIGRTGKSPSEGDPLLFTAGSDTWILRRSSPLMLSLCVLSLPTLSGRVPSNLCLACFPFGHDAAARLQLRCRRVAWRLLGNGPAGWLLCSLQGNRKQLNSSGITGFCLAARDPWDSTVEEFPLQHLFHVVSG